MLFIYKLHVSQSQHLQTQCQKNGGVGYNSPLLQNEQNKLTVLKQTHRYREHTNSCHMGGGLAGWVKMVKGFRKKEQNTS